MKQKIQGDSNDNTTETKYKCVHTPSVSNNNIRVSM